MPLAPDSVLAALVDLVLPAECAGCGRPRAPLCEGCAARLLAELAVSGPPSRHWPVPTPDGFPLTVAGGVHHGLLAGLVVAFKDGDRADLARVLGPVLAGGIDVVARGALVADPDRPVAVVPVPSARAAFRRRGRRPTLELARAAASVLGPRAVVVDALAQVRAPRDQAGLGRDARMRNLTGTMALRGGSALRGRIAHRGVRAGARGAEGAAALVVVDDVVTSGATLTEAVRALAPLGLPVVAAVVGARRRGARPGV